MGQYFIVVNIDKQEYLHPHRFGDGLKLLEFGDSSGGTLTALTLLLRSSDEGGGGDIDDFEQEIIGSWAGDRIVIAGDYDAPGKWMTEGQKRPDPDQNLYGYASHHFKDVSYGAMRAMCSDPYLRRQLRERMDYELKYNRDRIPGDVLGLLTSEVE